MADPDQAHVPPPLRLWRPRVVRGAGEAGVGAEDQDLPPDDGGSQGRAGLLVIMS